MWQTLGTIALKGAHWLLARAGEEAVKEGQAYLAKKQREAAAAETPHP